MFAVPPFVMGKINQILNTINFFSLGTLMYTYLGNSDNVTIGNIKE